MAIETNLCPKGVKPCTRERRCGGMNCYQIIIECHCGCMRVKTEYTRSTVNNYRTARDRVVREWNSKTAGETCKN